MKFRYVALSAVLLTLTGLVWAAPDMRPHKQLHSMAAGTAAMEHADVDGCNMSPMHAEMNRHENMQRMHDQMTQIRHTEDPARREELVQQHLATMEQTMRMMQAVQKSHHGNHMGHMMSQGMSMSHGTGAGPGL